MNAILIYHDMYLSVEYTWTSDVQRIHRFTDDIQLYISYDPAVSDELENVKQLLIQCISNITAWKLIHKLKLNNDKTEFMVMQSPHNVRVYGIPSLEPPGRILQSTDAARNMGCYFDRHMQLDRLISSYCSSAYYHSNAFNECRTRPHDLSTNIFKITHGN